MITSYGNIRTRMATRLGIFSWPGSTTLASIQILEAHRISVFSQPFFAVFTLDRAEPVLRGI